MLDFDAFGEAKNFSVCKKKKINKKTQQSPPLLISTAIWKLPRFCFIKTGASSLASLELSFCSALQSLPIKRDLRVKYRCYPKVVNFILADITQKVLKFVLFNRNDVVKIDINFFQGTLNFYKLYDTRNWGMIQVF